MSTKGRYAVTAVVDLALYEEGRLVSLAEISESQNISLSYLEQLFSGLRRHNIVKGIRGPGGGYKLARPKSEISIADIVSAVDESIDVMKCAGSENCHNGQKCLTHGIWSGLTRKIYDFLDELTLEEVLKTSDIVDFGRLRSRAKK